MQEKPYKMRSLSVKNGKATVIDLKLEFDKGRAFVVWDTIEVGAFSLKARVEIDPGLLQPEAQADFDYIYRGQLILPRPENN